MDRDMEVGEYETNTLAISNIASIVFRVYRPVVSASAALFAFSPSDVEKSLRHDGHLVFADSRRQGIWCFRLLRKDGSAIGSPTKSELNTTIDVGPYKLTTVSEGSFDPGSLMLGKPAGGANLVNTPNSSASSAASMAPQPPYGLPTVPTTIDLTSSQTTAASGTSTADTDAPQTGGSGSGVHIQSSQVPQGSAGLPSEPRSAFPAVPTKVVYNFFMSAVLASLSTAYCSHAKAIALNNRTFLLPPLDPLWDGEESSRTDSRSLIATLRITLTTAGALLVSLSHSLLRGMGCSEWECYAGVPPPGSAVLTAPWGKFATVQDSYPSMAMTLAEDSKYAVARLKKGVPMPAVPHAWKSFAAKMLEMRGTSASVLHDSSWLQIEFLLDDETSNGNSVVILWPSVLCFWCLEDSLVTAAPFQKLDPLSALREAYMEELRAEDAASRPKEAINEEDVVMEDVQTVSSVGKGPQSDGPSPLGVRHPLGPGAAATAAGIYPTPPDGIPNLLGATPTFDGTTSSPGNFAGTSAPVDLEPIAADRPGADEGFGEIWPNAAARQDDQDQAFIGEPDHLLGEDIGADMFGDDVTDADFNFFDDTKPADPSNAANAANAASAANLAPGPSAGPAMALALDKMDVDTAGQLENSPAAGTEAQAASISSETQADTSTAASKPEVQGPSYSTMPPPPPPSQQRSSAEEKTAESSEKTDKTLGSPVFVKPELRHARSNLEGPRTGALKRSSSPFNAMTVFKRVRAIAEANKALPPGAPKQALPKQPGKLFEGLQFTDFMIQTNKKYELNGKFGFSWPHPEADMLSDLSSATSPTAFRRPPKKQPGLSDSSPQFASLISSITRGLKSSSLQSAPSPLALGDSGDTSSNSSSTSSSSEDSDDDEAPLAVTAAHRKMRARATAEMIPSPEAATELSRAYSEGVWDFSIARFFAEPLPQPAELNYDDDDVADVAQILTQQITRSTIRSVFDEDDGQDLQKSKLRQTLLQRIRYSVATLEDSLPASLDGASRCALKPYLDVQDTLQLGPPGRLHPRAPPGADQRFPNLFPAPTPLVGIRRNESTLSIKPTGIEFWEVLGLEPLHGAKDIRAVCAYPNYQGLSNDVSNFLARMRIVYESLRLGSHEPLSAKANVVNGMVAFNPGLSSSSPLAQMSSPGADFSGADQVHKLAQALAAEDTPGKSLVVYFVYCPDITTAIVDACLAFQRLSQLYEIAVTSRSTEPNDLVLQLIPIDFISSSTSLAVPSSSDLLYLSLELYDRCASPRGPKPAPAFLLEQPPARNLDLKLSSTPLVDVQRENSCIHVAYAMSADERWITAAWTDGSGWRQFSSAYWIGRKDAEGSVNSFDAVAREIWTNTCAIVSNLKVHWRAIIAKCGQMEPEEVSIWSELAKAETRASISLTLVTADTKPTLELLPPVITVNPTVLSQLTVATAAGGAPTPQASSVFSPEQSGNPMTPAGGFGNNPTTPAGTPAGGAPTPATPGGTFGKAAASAAPNSPAVPQTPATAAAAAAAAAVVNANNDASAKLAAAGADPNTVADIEGTVVLVDVTDNTWIAVAAHRLNTASTWVDLRPALVSGYLIKRGGIGRDDAPVVLEVNVVHVDAKHRANDALVRDILTSYRSLGTLARVRGILDNERDARPWHIAAAERAARSLCRWM
ncbi:hypothetical protein SEUCBS140593_000397 [Sporothrix eucalyptigena]|uniref:Mediator of RNA polymerase II transcription subunit 13 n=1 Tax=Sporothrix eucalyptigena TaxID=1812306 RepID=A0ABP0APJ8_9PEZI